MVLESSPWEGLKQLWRGILGGLGVPLLIHSLREDGNSFQDYGSFWEFPRLLISSDRDRVTFKNLGIFNSHVLNWVGWSGLLDPQGSTLVMGDQVGLHQLLDVLILGLLQRFNSNDFTTFQGSCTSLSCSEIHMELTVALLCIFCSGNHRTVSLKGRKESKRGVSHFFFIDLTQDPQCLAGDDLAGVFESVPSSSDTPFHMVQTGSNVYSHDTPLCAMLDEFTTIILWLASDSEAKCACSQQLGETIFILAKAGLAMDLHLTSERRKGGNNF
jgi:hypothetical protein